MHKVYIKKSSCPSMSSKGAVYRIEESERAKSPICYRVLKRQNGIIARKQTNRERSYTYEARDVPLVYHVSLLIVLPEYYSLHALSTE